MIKKILSELFDSFKKGEIPKIDFHLHTNWTDGKNSISEIYENAKKKGLKIIVFSEHVRNTSNWYQKFSSEVKNLPTKYCKAIAGCEAKILNSNGDLDLNNSILENSQAIMAVVHRFPGELGQIINDKKISVIKML